MFDSFSFHVPKNIDLLVFDQCNLQILQKAIPEKYSFEIYPQNPGIFWINSSVLFKLMLSLLNSQFWNETVHARGYFYGFLRALYLYYLKSTILAINPKGVISYIDNSDIYSWLAKSCKEIPFFAVQNGARLSIENCEYGALYFQHYFSFGEHEKDIFHAQGWKSKFIYPVGSLAASVYSIPGKQSTIPKCYDLLIVSSWRGNIGYTKGFQETMKSMRVMDRAISEYLAKKNIKAAIILRSEVNDKDWYIDQIGQTEEEYYRNIYSDRVDIIRNNFATRPIYKLIMNSKVIVSCLSTALFEALSFNKPIMFFNFCDSDAYHKDIPDLFKVSDQEKVGEVLDALIEKSDVSYEKEYKVFANRYMSSYENMKTYQAISVIIEKVIKKTLVSNIEKGSHESP